MSKEALKTFMGPVYVRGQDQRVPITRNSSETRHDVVSFVFKSRKCLFLELYGIYLNYLKRLLQPSPKCLSLRRVSDMGPVGFSE